MKKMIVTILVLLFLYSQTALAYDTGSGVINVGRNCAMKCAEQGISRTLNYSYVYVKANSVYPLSSGVTDDYTKCRTRIYYNGHAISDTVVLTETINRKVYINEGYLSSPSFNLYFSGNNPDLAAGISYSYDGR